MPSKLRKPPTRLQAIAKVLASWKDLGWPMIRKHHWLLHAASNFANHAILPTCFCMERKNKVVDQQAAAIQNTTALERSTMQKLLVVHIQGIRHLPLTCLSPNQLPRSFGNMVFGPMPHMRIQHNATCSCGDAVLVESAARPPFEAGIVRRFLSFQGQDARIIQMFSFVSGSPNTVARQVAFPLNQVLTPVYWTQNHFDTFHSQITHVRFPAQVSKWKKRVCNNQESKRFAQLCSQIHLLATKQPALHAMKRA